MDGKAEADAEEARYVQSKPPLGPEGGSQGIRTDIRPGHGSLLRSLWLCSVRRCVELGRLPYVLVAYELVLKVRCGTAVLCNGPLVSLFMQSIAMRLTIAIPVAALLLAAECSAFAAKKSGGAGKRAKKSAGGGGGGGFGAAAPIAAKPPPSTPELQEIVLGPAKTVYINVPPNQLAPEQMNRGDVKKFAAAPAGSAARAALLDKFGEYRGRGDVIWPSSLQLGRLIANCPSFVAGRRCIDLGCGLGLASLATLLGKPSHLALSDVDEEVLRLAVRSCTEFLEVMPEPSIKSVERLKLDWADETTWPQTKGDFEFVCASDVLYDESAAVHIARLLSHLLGEGSRDTTGSGEGGEEIISRALIVDPANRENRDKFVEEAAKNGLEAEALPFPGNEDEFVLISVTPSVQE